MQTALGTHIIREAERWLERQCAETSANRGPCVDEIHLRFGGTVKAEAWCAKFVWVVVDEACVQTGTKNRLPFTAGARALLTGSDGKLRVDGNPEPGAAFYRRSTAPGASGHVGIVVAVESDGIYTIEGNTSDRVAMIRYDNQYMADPAHEMRFIHTELMEPVIPVEQAPVLAGGSYWGWLVAAGLVGWGIYGLTKT